jgi:transcriptional regulator with XRE-family HTH domain
MTHAPAASKGATARSDVPELRDLGAHVAATRRLRGLSQAELAGRCGLTQGAISTIESGDRRPSLDQFFRIARALDVPLQRLIDGHDRPGGALPDIAVQLRSLGIVDLRVRDAKLPGAFLTTEEAIALTLQPDESEPRLITAMPALLAWNDWNFHRLVWSGAANDSRLRDRIGWLADIALAIDRRAGFPGGCRAGTLSAFVAHFQPHVSRSKAWDGLGHPMRQEPRSPIWRRWRINFDADIKEFEHRAAELVALGGGPRREFS